MTITRAYKTELRPTTEQRESLAKHVRAQRVAHNWAIQRWHELAGARAFCDHSTDFAGAAGLYARLQRSATPGRPALWVAAWAHESGAEWAALLVDRP